MWWRSRRALAGAFSVLVLALWCSRSPAIPVEAAEVRSAELKVEVSTNGKIEPVDKAEVRARLAGRIVEIPDPGTRIAKGEILLRIDDGPVSGELAAARSERLAALDSLRKAQDDLARVRRRAATDRELHEQKGITDERYRESRAELKQARSRVEFLESEVPLRVASLDLRIAELEEQLRGATVRAASNGTVYRIEAKRGETIRAGDLVLRFADLGRLRVRANVDQVDLGRVEMGQAVHISANAFPGRTWSARITELIPNVELKQSRFVAEGLAEIDPPTEGLVPGMTVDVQILVAEVAEALQIPADAVFTDEEGSFVYRIDGGRARETRVSVGRSTVATIEIVEGLETGARVVLGPVTDLADGARVEVGNDG